MMDDDGRPDELRGHFPLNKQQTTRDGRYSHKRMNVS
jgi:hypothetical protein